MIKLLKHFTVKQWVLLVLLFVFLIGQSYCDVTLPTYTAELVTKMQSGASTASILSTGYTMLMYAGISIACVIVVTFISYYISTTQAKILREKLYTKVESFSLEEMTRFSTPSLITRSTNDIQQVSGATMMLFRIGFAAPLIAVLALIKINSASFELTTAMAIGISILIAGIMVIMFVVMPRFKLIQKLLDRINGVTRENLTGIRIIRAFNAEEKQKQKFDEVNEKFTKNNIFANRVMGMMNPLIMLINYGLTVAIYWLGCYLIIRDNNPAMFPVMFSFTQLSAQVVMSFMMIVMILLMLPRAQISANRINEVLNTQSVVLDPDSPESLPDGGEIEFKNVSFSYPNAAAAVLSDISLKINTGETAAFIGLTGAGKSTLVHLIPRFFDASSGEITVNGVNVKNVRQDDLRNTIGYVPQKSVLFSGTVRENIALGVENMPDEDIRAAAKAACAEEFIDSLPEKYEALVSQGGKNFSGGQKQRLSIARAIAKKPQIYIFDDSFSALDYKTDREVRQNLKGVAYGATKLIVAQRIGTIVDADKIFVLQDGRLISSGTHSELLGNCEVYKEIALSQLSSEELGL